MKHRLAQTMAAVSLAVTVCGCASVRNDNSVAFVGPICCVMNAPLAGDFSKCKDLSDLKKGVSSEVVYFQFYYPLVSAGDESIKSAMRNGNLKEVYYADYSVRFFFILGWYTVSVYGR